MQNSVPKKIKVFFHELSSNSQLESYTPSWLLFDSKASVASKVQITWHDLQIKISDNEETVLATELIKHLQKLC